VFFPDATKAVVRTLDSRDIEASHTPGILVNTYHLYADLGRKILTKFGGIREFMGWEGALISDSGGFQVMSLVKQFNGKVTDEGVSFNLNRKKKISLTPETSISFQMKLKPDMAVVLDDFTPPTAKEPEARETVERTILWAKRSKDEFEKQCKRLKLIGDKKPYLLAVVQGGKWQELRAECAERLVKIGFDGYGYGGWPMDEEGNFDYQSAQTIFDHTPKGALLYGLGIGKPDEVVNLVKMGYHIFDCVLPTRDARHGRLYVFKADSIKQIDIHSPDFFGYYVPDKEKNYSDESPVSTACDCLLCTHYSRAYLYHLFKIKDLAALRLATIHNLRFYSLLMEKLQDLRDPTP
jgi:queuine tRNA-ribosyltransferase